MVAIVYAKNSRGQSHAGIFLNMRREVRSKPKKRKIQSRFSTKCVENFQQSNPFCGKLLPLSQKRLADKGEKLRVNPFAEAKLEGAVNKAGASESTEKQHRKQQRVNKP